RATNGSTGAASCAGRSGGSGGATRGGIGAPRDGPPRVETPRGGAPRGKPARGWTPRGGAPGAAAGSRNGAGRPGDVLRAAGRVIVRGVSRGRGASTRL